MSRHLDELLKKDTDERGDALAFYSDEQRAQIFAEWADDERLRITDVALLPEPYRTHMVRFVVGEGAQPGTAKMFRLAPNPGWDPPPHVRDIPKEIWEKMRGCVELERGRRNGKSVMLTISRPISLAPAEALRAIYLYGPQAPIEWDKDRLIEVDDDWSPPEKKKGGRK